MMAPGLDDATVSGLSPATHTESRPRNSIQECELRMELIVPQPLEVGLPSYFILPDNSLEASAVAIKRTDNNLVVFVACYSPPCLTINALDIRRIANPVNHAFEFGNLNSKHCSWHFRIKCLRKPHTSMASWTTRSTSAHLTSLLTVVQQGSLTQSSWTSVLNKWMFLLRCRIEQNLILDHYTVITDDPESANTEDGHRNFISETIETNPSIEKTLKKSKLKSRYPEGQTLLKNSRENKVAKQIPVKIPSTSYPSAKMEYSHPKREVKKDRNIST